MTRGLLPTWDQLNTWPGVIPREKFDGRAILFLVRFFHAVGQVVLEFVLEPQEVGRLALKAAVPAGVFLESVSPVEALELLAAVVAVDRLVAVDIDVRLDEGAFYAGHDSPLMVRIGLPVPSV